MAGTGALFLAPGASYSAFTGPLPTGCVGGAFLLLLGAWCWLDIKRKSL